MSRDLENGEQLDIKIIIIFLNLDSNFNKIFLFD